MMVAQMVTSTADKWAEEKASMMVDKKAVLKAV
jgi:hypothetical protein